MMDARKLSNDELRLLHGCIREAMECLNDDAQFHARVGVGVDEAKRIMEILGNELTKRTDHHGNWVR
jgi:hypothetical protein